MILLQFEAEFLIPLEVTEYGAAADRREGDLSMYAYRSLPFQYKMTRFVQECDQLSPAQQDETTLKKGQVVMGSKLLTSKLRIQERGGNYVRKYLPSARVNWKEPSIYLVVT